MKGFYCICNHGGVEVEVIDSDTVTYKWFDEEPKEAEILYDEDRAYFLIEEEKYYLDEFVKTDN